MKTYDQPHTYGELISYILQSAEYLQPLTAGTLSRKATKRLQAQLLQRLGVCEQDYVTEGVNFLRTQVNTIRQQYAQGKIIEFETVGPYLANYSSSGGKMTLANLTPEDTIGVRLAALFRSIFPKARFVSLCDEYNQTPAGAAAEDAKPKPFTDAQRRNFFESFAAVLQDVGAIAPDAVEGKDYLLLAESANVQKAEQLVALLNESGHIEESKGALYFINPTAENPLHRRFCLRTPHGRWLCETLDAAGFLAPVNKDILHLIILPEYMKVQQDRVWELLRVLGIHPSRHHNIFFDHTQPPEAIVASVARAFSRH